MLPPNRVTPVLYTERWAYAPVGSYGGRQLFDLSVDPLAETNLVEEHRDVADDLHPRSSRNCKRWTLRRRLWKCGKR